MLAGHIDYVYPSDMDEEVDQHPTEDSKSQMPPDADKTIISLLNDWPYGLMTQYCYVHARTIYVFRIRYAVFREFSRRMRVRV